MNPMVFSRTGLATQPYVTPGRRWHLAAVLDYASPIEYASNPRVFYLMDAELMRLELTVTRDVRKNAFLLVQGSFNGAYDGSLDGFLQWYHDLVGLQVEARRIRPKNKFGYELDLADGRHLTYTNSAGYPGDLRLGAGIRHSPHWQTVVSVTLPTSAGTEGFTKGVASANATSMLRSDFWKRFTYEGSIGAGYTPRISSPLSSPLQVGVPDIRAVHCDSASTNTRSKNSSSEVTRSPSRITAVRRGARLDVGALTALSSQLPPRPQRGRARGHRAGLAPAG